jgi:hypothetical protein
MNDIIEEIEVESPHRIINKLALSKELDTEIVRNY